jgi:hypothetical protein
MAPRTARCMLGSSSNKASWFLTESAIRRWSIHGVMRQTHASRSQNSNPNGRCRFIKRHSIHASPFALTVADHGHDLVLLVQKHADLHQVRVRFCDAFQCNGFSKPRQQNGRERNRRMIDLIQHHLYIETTLYMLQCRERMHTCTNLLAASIVLSHRSDKLACPFARRCRRGRVDKRLCACWP